MPRKKNTETNVADEVQIPVTETIESNPNVRVELEFSKEQILASEAYRSRRDLVDALLDNNRMYTMKTVDEAIDKFMKGQVK